jgi:GNAT superfamily N-acetyltransferase
MSGALASLAAQLREEDSPVSAHLVDPAPESPVAGEYALLFEAIREGYLLHYEEPRLLAGHDDDLALLAGDYLYALGLARLAELGDAGAVLLLADLIGRCAQLHAEGRGAGVAQLWEEAALKLGLEPPA